MTISPFKKRPDPFDYEILRRCKCCGNGFQGRFCNRCGEKVIESHERSLLNFLDSVLNAFTFLDGKFIKSLKMLVTRPGELSRNIGDGVRVPYMKMVSLFFLANFFYFFFPLWDSFNSSLYTQMNSLRHSAQATRMVNERLAKENISMNVFTEKYEVQSTNLSKLLLVLLAIMFALALMVINYSGKVYFFDHVLFSLEFYSFHILLNLLIISYIFLLLIKGGNALGVDCRLLLSDNFFSRLIMVTLGYFLFRGQIHFYNQKWYWGAVRSIALLFFFVQSIYIYRTILFYITMWTI